MVTLLIFGTLFVITSVPTWLVPRRYFPHYICWLIILLLVGTLSGWEPGGFDTPGHAFEVIFIGIAVFALTGAVLARMTFLLASRSRSHILELQALLRTKPTWFTRLTVGGIGAIGAFAALKGFAAVVQGYQPAWAAPAIMFLALIVILAFWRTWSKVGWARIPPAVGALANASLVGFCGASGLFLVGVLISPLLLRHEIEAIIGDKAYCVQIVDHANKLRSLPTLLDLSLLSIGSLLHNDSKSDEAPIIVQVGHSLTGLDWPDPLYSFGSRAPRNIVTALAPVVCEPKHNFLQEVPLAVMMQPTTRVDRLWSEFLVAFNVSSDAREVTSDDHSCTNQVSF